MLYIRSLLSEPELVIAESKLVCSMFYLIMFFKCTERVTVDNQLESGYDFKIKLLEEELQRLDKHKTVKPAPIFSTAFAI